MTRSDHQLTFVFAAFATALLSSPSMAEPSTSQGLISVAQVMEMLEKAPVDRTAQQVLTAYLAGVGEAAGAVASMGNAACRTSLTVSAAHARRALKPVALKPDLAEIPATPMIVRDMLERAGCHGPRAAPAR